ncbi:MAG TPA: hypothetical protein VLD58_06035 [Gemmatimonadales bacterium]|nr:hypothetical protein [Gemmatimonadales bacterium]
MAFSRTVLGWVVVTLLFVLWREVERRVKGTPGGVLPSLKANLPALAIEALLLTLFAGLWFGSLGSGGAWLLFLVVGSLMEIPSRLRGHPLGSLPWREIIPGIGRIMIAGVLLGFLLA